MAGVRRKGEAMLFSRARRIDREAAGRIYRAALLAARRPHFYLRCGVPDTFEGRFEMLALNLFPAVQRLMHDPGDDPQLARLVAECLVEDMDDALRQAGVSDTRVPKSIKALYGSFAGRIAAYGKALGEDDSAIEAAVARNVFPDGAAGDAAALARYLRAAVEALRAPELQEIRRGDLPFPATEVEGMR
jgi:cytochrome b pre-mRNA-processing protein 3